MQLGPLRSLSLQKESRSALAWRAIYGLGILTEWGWKEETLCSSSEPHQAFRRSDGSGMPPLTLADEEVNGGNINGAEHQLFARRSGSTSLSFTSQAQKPDQGNLGLLAQESGIFAPTTCALSVMVFLEGFHGSSGASLASRDAGPPILTPQPHVLFYSQVNLLSRTSEPLY